MRRRIAALVGLLLGPLMTACSSMAPAPPPLPARPDGQVLWRIVHDQCVPGQRDRQAPAPCAAVSLADGEAKGFVVLKDRTGTAQHLLMPTAKITGIEDEAVLAPDATNYFSKAWDQRHFVDDRLGRRLSRGEVSITVNSAYGRTQDQLHLHIDCLDASVGAALASAHIAPSRRWRATVVELKGHRYFVRWLDAAELETTSPFQLLARSMPDGRRSMASWTIAMVGAARPDGRLGFYLLADKADLAAGDKGSAEELQDHSCGR